MRQERATNFARERKVVVVMKRLKGHCDAINLGVFSTSIRQIKRMCAADITDETYVKNAGVGDTGIGREGEGMR